MKLGVLGGTFDPIHNGHLAIADEVRSQLQLSEIIYVPAGQPWLKADRPVTSAEHRIAMLEMAISDRPCSRISMIDIERDGLTYTVDTLADLWKRLGADDEVYFIIGWGSLEELPEWKAPARIIRLCKLVAVPRPGYPLPDMGELDKRIPGLREKVIILDKPEIDISSSDIRERIAGGKSISGLVPRAVEDYIREKGLYKP